MDRSLIRPLWWYGALLMLLDALSTYWALGLGGAEANPLAWWSMGAIGVISTCVLKVIVCTIVVWCMAVLADGRFRWKRIGSRAQSWIQRIAGWELVFTAILMTAVVLNNFGMIVLLA